jgi:predicted XRE-type DNA-binding protein
VFADIETPDANEEFNKALLTMYIRQAINRQRLTKNAAAARMSIEEPMVSALINGSLASFSSEQLMRLLTGADRAPRDLAYIDPRCDRVPAPIEYLINGTPERLQRLTAATSIADSPRPRIVFAGAMAAILISPGERGHDAGSGLDVLRRRFSERVLDIKIRQGRAVFSLPARALATAAPGHS